MRLQRHAVSLAQLPSGAPSTIECFGACIFEDSNLIFICRDFQSGEKIG
jgi:hypothetical protein